MPDTLNTTGQIWSSGARGGAPRVFVARLRESPLARAVAVVAIAILIGLSLGALVTAATPLYVAGALAGVAALVLVIADTRLGLLALVGIITLLPFGVIPVPLGTFKLTFLDVTLVLMLIGWLARLLMRPDSRLTLTGVEPLVLLFVGLAVAAFLLGTGTTSETTRLFLKWLNSVLLFFTAVNAVRSVPTAKLVVGSLIAAGAVSAAIGIFLYVIPAASAKALLLSLGPLGYPTTGDVLRYLPSTTTMRAISTSVDPNVFGALLMLCAVFGVSQVLSVRPVFPRLILLPMLGVSVAALLLSYSRGSWIGLFAGCMVIALLRYRRPWVLVALGLGVVALALAPGLGGFFSHLESGIYAQDQAAAMRLGEYKDAFRLIQQYPIFGVGFGAAPDVDLYIGVSSIYLLLAEQMGLLGLAAYLAVVGTVLWRALKIALKDASTEADSLLIGAVAALISALVAGVLDHHFANIVFPHMTALFWLVCALCVVTSEFVGAESRVAADEEAV